MSRDSKELDQLVDNAIVCEYGGCTDEAPCRNHAEWRRLHGEVKDAIQQYCDQRVKEARIDELKRLEGSNRDHYGWFIRTRLQELEPPIERDKS